MQLFVGLFEVVNLASISLGNSLELGYIVYIATYCCIALTLCVSDYLDAAYCTRHMFRCMSAHAQYKI